MTRVPLLPDQDPAALVRGCGDGSVVLTIEPGRDRLALALAVAAIGPLAIERAPAARVNAILAAPGADPADVDAAVAWLERARSTTGQVIEISAPAAASARTAPMR